MVPIRIFKKFLIPSAVALALADGDKTGEQQSVCDADGKRLVRPSDLPIYGDECYVCGEKQCEDPCALEAQIGHLRKELWVWVDKYKGYRQEVIEVCATGKVHAEVPSNPPRTLYLEADGSPKEPRSVAKNTEVDENPKSNKVQKRPKLAKEIVDGDGDGPIDGVCHADQVCQCDCHHKND